MDFSMAVEQLVQCHVREVQELQKQSSEMQQLLVLTRSSSRGSWSPMGKVETMDLPHVEADSHNSPLPSAEVTARATLPRSTPSRTSEIIVTPTKGPTTPRLLLPHLSQMSSPTASRESLLGTDSPVFSVFNSPRIEYQGKTASTFAITSQGSLESTNSRELSAATVHWRDLVEGILGTRVGNFTLRPGWMVDPSTPLSGNGTGCQTRVVSRSIVVPPLGVMALAKEESIARDKLTDVRGGFLNKYKFGTGSTHTTTFVGAPSSLISHPASPTRRVWILLCFVVILYEVFSITMTPFDIMEGRAAKVMEWFSACFWAIDIVVNFCSGIYVNGKVEMRFAKIAKNYFRTWFLFDFVVASSQVLALALDVENLNATFFFRVIRIIRSFRCARIYLWMRDELGCSSTTAVAAITGSKLAQFVIILYFFIHCNACIWFEIGKSKDGWIVNYQQKMNGSPGGDYLISLHWALSQLQGNVDVYPGKPMGERFFVVVSSACSIVALTLFVSSMTDQLFDARQQEKCKLDNMRLLLDLFHRHDIAPELRARAEFFLHQKMKQQTAIQGNDHDDRALQLFPPQFRSLLLAEIRSSSLVWHPVFVYLRKYHTNVFVKVCSTALSCHTYEPSEDVFTIGELSSRGYFISGGDFVLNVTFDVFSMVVPWLGATFVDEMSNRRDSMGSVSTETMTQNPLKDLISHNRPVRKLAKGQFVSEISLWMSWGHTADLCSVGHGQCVCVNTTELITSLERHPISHATVSSYACRFVTAAKIIHQVGKSQQVFELMNFDTVLDTEGLS